MTQHQLSKQNLHSKIKCKADIWLR